MTKELLTVEFRYLDRPKNENDRFNKEKIVTIGIFDTIEEAIKKGNETLKILNSKFTFWEIFQIKDRFNLPTRLVADDAYKVFISIKQLKFDDLKETMDETFEALNRYIDYKKRQEFY